MPKSRGTTATSKAAATAAAGTAAAEPQPTLAAELAAAEADNSTHPDDSSIHTHTDDESDFQDAADGTTPSLSEADEPRDDSETAAADSTATERASAPADPATVTATDELDDASTPMPTATEFPSNIADLSSGNGSSEASAPVPSTDAADAGEGPSTNDTVSERSKSVGKPLSPSLDAAPSSSPKPTVAKGIAALKDRFESTAAKDSSSPKPPVRTTSRPDSDQQSSDGAKDATSLPLSASTITITDSRQESLAGDVEPISSADVKQGEGSELILDEESARQTLGEQVEKIPPSQGATSLLEPDETISNPFATDKESPRASTAAAEADPQRFSSADSVIRSRSREPSTARDVHDPSPDTPSMNSNHFSVVSLGSTTASVANGAVAASDAWGGTNDAKRATVMMSTGDAAGGGSGGGGGERTTGNYDFLLARLETQNAKLTTDPKAMRNSMDGADKLRENFEKLREKDQARHSRGESQNRALNGVPIATAPEEAAEPGGQPVEGHEAGLHWEGPPGEELEDEAINWEFWGNVMSNYQQVARTQPRELSRAIQAGIPAALRGMMWQLMSSSKDEEMEIIYAYYLKQSSPHEKAIRRDLNRTFPEQDYFQDGKGIGQENLFNVVKAYSLYDPEVGYCQGMQCFASDRFRWRKRLCAEPDARRVPLPLHPQSLQMPDEEAFSTLVRLMKSYDLRGHFTPAAIPIRPPAGRVPSAAAHAPRPARRQEQHVRKSVVHDASYRFPLELVYRILDSVFAEGVEALFRFALALMKRNEEELLKLNFDSAVSFLKQSLFDVYLKSDEAAPEMAASGDAPAASDAPSAEQGDAPKRKKVYNTNEFVRDAFQIKITPFMLDSYASEFDEQVRAANAHRREVEALRLVNRNLAARVKALEDQLNSVNKEHVDLVKSVVMAKIAKEEMAEELVKYKMM
ncbi:related to GYP5 - GTPase-activating protein (GAP) [Pseudozyma flocculosa]|uniref:Related to GYP5 - GTPase-activating protein (GAP) n=1 Tax=Pseudozyma flocculosa TaxID=84751 RepID=A0A5C3F8A9_9BASI|nr:related to GYP5 - GTPase-activating protein (GAP) [Pseudozyma flocculosa]